MPVARVAGPRLHSSEMEPVVAQGFFPGRPMVKRMRLRRERIRELIILCLKDKLLSTITLSVLLF